MSAAPGVVDALGGAANPAPASQARLALIRRASVVLAAAAWLYTIAVAVFLLLHVHDAGAVKFFASWCGVPLQSIGLLLGGYLALRRGLVKPWQRTVWWFVLAYVAVNLLATCIWNAGPLQTQQHELQFVDILYLADYWIFIGVFAVLFVQAGGNFKQPRVWLDAITLLSVQLLGAWSFFLAPAAPHNAHHSISIGATIAYSMTMASLLTMVALLCLQVTKFRGRYGLFFLFGAAASAIGSDLSWLANWLTSIDTSTSFYNYGDVICMACLFSATAAAQFKEHFPNTASDAEQQVFGFLPALLVLLAIACVVGYSLREGRTDVWILFGSAAVCVQLLLTRQASMRKELRELNRRLAAQAVEIRLTELVRRSSDLLVIVGRDGLISFASPAVEPMLGVAVAAVVGTGADTLLGPAHRDAMNCFLRSAAVGADGARMIELHLERPRLGACDLKISASDQRQNPFILGIVLTIHDVSAQRAAEREVLDAVTRERIRLCADIHDGLGQELTGIALLLRTAAVAPDPQPQRQREQLLAIVGQVSRAIGTARDLAHDYSPLHVVRGSLVAALRRLTQDADHAIALFLEVDDGLDDRLIGDFAADHLYRIAQEAITNAQRHSGAKHIVVRLQGRPEGLKLSICDDGSGIQGTGSEREGLGLHLMTYRAGLIGGTFRAYDADGHGACIEVTVPVPALNARLRELGAISIA